MNILRLIANNCADLVRNREVLIELARRDFKSRYLGSFLGVLWAFVNPAVYIAILWFVFQLGFKAMPTDNVPFILWLIPGIIAWFFISDGIAGATHSILDYSFLVKKVVFRVSVLPIVKIISALYVHLFFLVFLFIVFLVYGFGISIYSLQVLYYLFASLMLVLGISWITSSVAIFFRDAGQIVQMALQFGFWLTPVFWSVKSVPQKYLFLLKLNPLYYIISGYRNSFIYKIWFWETPLLTLYYWVVTAVVLVTGLRLFRKMRPHFADML
ncbi:ABC transporter permease [Candidatus Magnetominusculus xianensis]|uniref:Transport permease protein n=1 Tax=Candidatus Magnetominusculus xianensis TaxID=1748249 RepID=A0ABR5SJF0_9BACT|nr:ABC transporter permease [Candidatus Magnetominusculus xianensis]KWT94501.1 teichoic acid ABC transporter permease [Candidatus Magnetominusculus xianensis]MBF0405105.1 ABC transporter permease [Nitrospirota bacterium]